MQKRSIISVILLCGLSLSFSQRIYDINHYIENPAMFAENQTPPHATLMPYSDVTEAKKDDWNESPFYKSLNGTWKFHWAPNPLEAPIDFHRIGYNVSHWDHIEVPGVWQMQGYGHNMYRNIPQALQPYNPPMVPDDLNPTGSYRTTFTIPWDWDNRRIFLHFDGVKSCAFVWINGRYVGYDQGSMTPAEYDITDFIKRGENTLAVRVMRWSDGSYLEDQDMWRFSGIYRRVYLFATPTVHIRDFAVSTDLDSNYRNATLKIDAEIKNYTKEPAGQFSVLAQLFTESGKKVSEFEKRALISQNETIQFTLLKEIDNPQKWSAEQPNLYILTLSLKDESGYTIEVLSDKIGFRKLEIKDGLALVNGVAVDFMGVNRHEHHPEFGRTMTEKMMRQDLELMKKFNVNAVRLCHYPNDPLWYDLCDEYGIYVQDEVNAECHYGEDFMADWPGMESAYMDRFSRMVQRDKNHPSVVMWSTGNECGTGAAHFLMADYLQKTDTTRFVMHQDHSGTAAYTDIIGPRYITPAMFLDLAKTSDKPVVSGEYAHAMGNSLGHFDEYWKLFRRYDKLQGGFIWDWVDQGLRVNLSAAADQSPYNNIGYLMGRPEIVGGKQGSAVALSGLDDWIELYRDRSLDITGKEITLETWIYPRKWNGTNPLITKGNTAFGLSQSDEDHLEFYIHNKKRYSALAKLPADWYYNWHHVAGLYDGTSIQIVIDGKVHARTECTAEIGYNHYPVCIGRNAELHHQQFAGWLSNATFDNVRIYARALSVEELQGSDADATDIRLKLDFDNFEQLDEYVSYGVSPFCINGVVFPDRGVQPETWQMKKSQQPVSIEPVDLSKGLVKVANYHNFTNLDEFDINWRVSEDDKEIDSGSIDADIPPREQDTIKVYMKNINPQPGRSYWLDIDVLLPNKTMWAPKKHTVAFEQFQLPFYRQVTSSVEASSVDSLFVQQSSQKVRITGDDFIYTFDRELGTLFSIRFDDTEILEKGPVLNAYRAPILNEDVAWGVKETDEWHSIGLDRLEHTTMDFNVTQSRAGHVRVAISSFTSAPGFTAGFVNDYVYEIFDSGDIILNHTVTPVGKYEISYLPKIGLQCRLSSQFDRFTWYGRGPWETYPDRKTANRMGVYTSSIDDHYVPYLVPQDCGNKTDVKWAAFENYEGTGLAVFARESMNVSVTPYSNVDRALYAFQLQETGALTVNFDHKVSGVGGTPVNARPAYRTYPQRYSYSIRFKPYNSNETDPLILSRTGF